MPECGFLTQMARNRKCAETACALQEDTLRNFLEEIMLWLKRKSQLECSKDGQHL